MGWRRPQESGIRPPARTPGTPCPAARSWSGTPMTWSPAATPGSRPSRSRPGSPRGWRPRGLVFNEDKTKIVPLTEGFDFLGFNVRRYRNGKLLIKPGTAAVGRLRSRLAAEMRALRGSNAAAVLAALNPIIRGWAAYYRGVVSSKIFGELDDYVWKLTWRWAKRTHSGKPKRWVAHRYFGRFDKFRNDRWVFGNRAGADERGSVPHLVKFSWTPIVRHQLVTGAASPDDPDLTAYWAAR